MYLQSVAHLKIAAAAKKACQGFRQPSGPHALLQALPLLALLLLLASLIHRQCRAADGAGVVLQQASGHGIQEGCSGRAQVKKKYSGVHGLRHASCCSRWERGQVGQAAGQLPPGAAQLQITRQWDDL